jgi:hypothetical protein
VNYIKYFVPELFTDISKFYHPHMQKPAATPLE